jgi:transcription elongation factor Elf1
MGKPMVCDVCRVHGVHPCSTYACDVCGSGYVTVTVEDKGLVAHHVCCGICGGVSTYIRELWHRCAGESGL